MTGQLFTARTVADRLSVSPETVLRWARRGELPAIHLSNRAIRFPEDQLEKWLAERATFMGDVIEEVGHQPVGVSSATVDTTEHEGFDAC